jgi:hypothetical protein
MEVKEGKGIGDKLRSGTVSKACEGKIETRKGGVEKDEENTEKLNAWKRMRDTKIPEKGRVGGVTEG